jgi:hypothetical protein
MRVRFTSSFDWTPPEDRRITLAFKAGAELTVRRECGKDAVAAGKAVDLDAEAFNGADPAAFDHDQDGAAGGSLPKARRKKPDAEA